MDPAEDEAALLAELRAISNKSASADRFASSSSSLEADGGGVGSSFPTLPAASVNDDDNENDGGGGNIFSTASATAKSTTGIQNTDQHFQDANAAPSEPSTALGNDVTGGGGVTATTEEELSRSPSASSQSSPQQNKDENVNTTITSENGSEKTANDSGPNRNLQQPSTFSGDRGGDAFDAELLAELRGISNKSNATDRFAGGEGGDADGVEDGNVSIGVTVKKLNQTAKLMPTSEPVKPNSVETTTPMAPTQKPRSSQAADKPWKRAKAAGVAKKAPSSTTGDDFEIVVAAPTVPTTTTTTATGADEASAPTASLPATTQDVDVSVSAATKENTKDPELENTNDALLSGGGGNFSTGSNFQGERGGDAQDAELLALLRGVSANSGASNRFGGGGGGEEGNGSTCNIDNSTGTPPTTSAPPDTAKPTITTSRAESVVGNVQSPSSLSQTSPQTKPRAVGVPPWKRGRYVKKQIEANNLDVEISVASPISKPKTTTTVDDVLPTNEATIQPDRPDSSTNDVQPAMNSNSSEGFRQKSTFQGERGGDANDAELLALLRGVSVKNTSDDRFSEDVEGMQPSQTKGTTDAPSIDASVTVGKQDASSQPENTNSEVDSSPVVEPGRGNFQQSSTFQGERGGEARDEELLALLRQAGTKQPSVPASSGPPSMFPDGESEEVVVSKKDLPASFSDKNWKVRKAAYQLLANILQDASKGNESGTLDGDSIISGLDGIIPTLLAEKNAVALEFAVQAVTQYADICTGGSSSEQAETIVSSLIKGNAFSSPRPSCVKATSNLVIKVIEVGSDKTSLDVVTSHLLQHGVSSKKAKVVQLSTSLILETALSFGAALLPLKPVVDELPRILSHSNKKIRDGGVEILAELCRALGSKAPLEPVIEKMQKTQVKELDALLSKRPGATPAKLALRCFSGSSPGLNEKDALVALQAGGEELERERFLARPAEDVLEKLKKTEYSSKLKLAKWSEKVGALSIVLECGGEKPYKLVQPSSSVNYTPLISDMKGLLKHTHFLVVSKALEVLSMLADGVGEKLFPSLRPVLPKLFELSKDKKLTKAVANCLDSFFGNVLSYENILDGDSAIPDATDESKQKNALARTSSLEFLDRAVTRGTAAGPRASLTPQNSKSCAKLAADKLNDSDATVRKAALQVLVSLQKIDDRNVSEAVSSVVEKLEQSNPRAYKSLSKGSQPKIASRVGPKSPNKSEREDTASPIPAKRQAPPPAAAKKHETVKSVPVKPAPTRETSKQNPLSPAIYEDSNLPNEESAVSYCQSLNIDDWNEPEDDGGVLSGLKSTKWQSRHAAIKKLALFVESRPLLESPSDAESDTTFLLVVVREHTRNFRETNMNVSRSILELFISLCDYHERNVWPFPKWAVADITALAVEKIADRKLSALSKTLLLELCVTHPPPVVLTSACDNAFSLKAPVAHEEFLLWMKTYLNQFGAQSIGSAIVDLVNFLIEECKSKNIKVKRAALAAIGIVHAHIGPSTKSIVLANVKDPSFRQEVEKSFSDHPFDPSLSQESWPKTCLVLSKKNSASDANVSSGTPDEMAGMGFNLPRTDLIAELPADCLSKMGANDNKTAWKMRKAALEDVEKVLKGSTGVLDTTKLRGMIDLLRAMRERLSDSQSNLKPLAARLIGDILGSVEGEEQGKLGKIVYGPLINAAMNDSRKIMHDASMGALQKGTSIPPVAGDGVNTQSLEPFIIALSLQLDDSEFKSAGISEVLNLTESFASHLPNLDNVASNRGDTLGGRFARVLVDALSSPKAEIRSAAESLLSECLQREVFSTQTAKKCTVRLVPAKQRSVGMILAKISSAQKNNNSNISTMDNEDEEIDARIASRASTRQIQDRNRTTSSKVAAEPRLNSKVIKHAPSNRKGISKASRHQDEDISRHDEVGGDISSTNPLVYESGPIGSQKSKSALRSLTWPEYPEEPSGSALYNGLKKAWAPIIPPESTKALFPDGGVRKQDDFMKGFEVISRAAAMEQAGEGMAVTEQLTFILRWSVFVMCSRESTVGLTGLLEMLAELVQFLVQSKHELSDSDAMTFVPYVFEKAGTAKGRFVDMYMDLIRSLKSGHLLPTSRLGPSVCVALMESSPHAKARLLACQECYACIETANLSGIGKKGVIVAAKNFSEEKLPENKAAFMDLMVLIASRMNNDMSKLAKICGSSLSSRARKSLEERVARGGDSGTFSSGKVSSPSKSRRNDGIVPRPLSRLPNSNQLSPASKPPPSRFKPSSHEDSTIEQTSFKDELPALDLRTELPKSPPMGRKNLSGSSTYDSSPLPSSLPRLSHIEDASNNGRTSSAIVLENNAGNSDRSTLATNLFKSPTDARSQQSADNWRVPSALSSASSDSEEAAVGAAASLRARLMKIKEKNKTSVINANTQSANLQAMLSRSQHESSEPKFFTENTYSSGSSSLITKDVLGSGSLPSSTSVDLERKPPTLTEILDGIQGMLGRPRPIPPEDPGIQEVGHMLQSIHAAATNQLINALELDEVQIDHLRQEIKDNISDVVTSLTKVIEFGFQCHPSTFNLGLSINLLSVNMASLMALFRDKDIADLVNVDDLTILIRESGRALLDPRLAPPSAVGTPGESTSQRLDETASTQIVRAINKLAVQVATGAKVETSVQALITLQEQLCLRNDQNDDKVFNVRLARIVTKLFGRLIKVESGSPNGFSADRIDTEIIICCLEDTLVKSNQDEKAGNHEGAASIRNLARLLLVAILQNRRESSTFRLTMEELDIDPSSSALGALVTEVAAELGLQDIPANDEGEQAVAKVDVSSLVTAVGSAENDQERQAALSALKQYKAAYGDEDLNSHLAEVSSAFRSFVLEQLSGSTENTTAVSESTDNSSATPVGLPPGKTHVMRPDASNGVGSLSNNTSSSMSDRIKSLRSKLSATEAAMQKIEPAQQQQQQQQQHNHQQQKENTHFSQQKAGMEKTDTAKAFRDRLAAAQEKQRLTAATNVSSSSSSLTSSNGLGGSSSRADADVGVGVASFGGGGGDLASMSPVPQTSAGSRAAALRARLQAVKQKNTGEEF